MEDTEQTRHTEETWHTQRRGDTHTQKRYSGRQKKQDTQQKTPSGRQRRVETGRHRGDKTHSARHWPWASLAWSARRTAWGRSSRPASWSRAPGDLFNKHINLCLHSVSFTGTTRHQPLLTFIHSIFHWHNTASTSAYTHTQYLSLAQHGIFHWNTGLINHGHMTAWCTINGYGKYRPWYHHRVTDHVM